MLKDLAELIKEIDSTIRFIASSPSTPTTIDALPQNRLEQFWDGIASARAGLSESVEALTGELPSETKKT
jgi:hypothetical protein